MTNTAELVRACFEAYRTKDRAAIETLIADDFRFTSPYDDRIDRATYFERCWPNADRFKSNRIVKLCAQGDEAFALYEIETLSGAKFRNTEFFRARNGQLIEVQVYFGEVAGVTPKP
jgi:ketosteroid isomerase-like protein